MEEDKLAKIKKNYEVAKKKYDLPDFEAIDKEFYIRKTNPEGFIILEVVYAISNKLRNMIGDIDPALSPNPGNLHMMVEMNAFGKEEKAGAFAFYKKLGYQFHKALASELIPEEEQVKFIKEFWKDWGSLKKQYLKYMDKIIAEWGKEEEKKSDSTEYLG